MSEYKIKLSSDKPGNYAYAVWAYGVYITTCHARTREEAYLFACHELRACGIEITEYARP